MADCPSATENVIAVLASADTRHRMTPRGLNALDEYSRTIIEDWTSA